ncbi:PIN domain-containing protein [Curtobacterium sp. MCBA15_012]|uniref:PIN domain-containing protein n=1 Tax=Curtobacterium sp. MCBA15_012 TaxID=1898738 RepID=UPI0011144CF9|nr:PIN domain-containing protein [Curtobacterium sp. MCBA15_012]WIA99420.1 hypothetical protein QOL15_12950 [Curtobacterium sp. MCBA15_012]
MSGPVVIDTDVYSHVIVSPEAAAARGVPVDDWRRALAGRPVLLSFQTRAELISGFRAARWGERRFGEALRSLEAYPTIGVDTEVLSSFVDLTIACRASGHALHSKVHTADRWVAACAIAKKLPLLAADRIYASAPGLDLLPL